MLGIARALYASVSNKTRFLTIVLGAAALAGLTYGVTRRGFQRRFVQPLASHVPASRELSLPETTALPLSAPDWETLSVHGARGSNPDALDIAMNLDGIFEGQSEDGSALTVRPIDHLPAPLGGDDEEAPNADDLGLAWLTKATQGEHIIGESDLKPEIENLGFAEETASDQADSEQDDEQVEHEDFRRTRA